MNRSAFATMMDNFYAKFDSDNVIWQVEKNHVYSSEMHNALRRRDLTAINKLLQSGVIPCIGAGRNCFILAEQYCGWNVVHRFLKIEPAGVHARNVDGESLLMLSASCPEKIIELLDLGADPLVSSRHGWSPLMFAVAYTKGSGRNAVPTEAQIQKQMDAVDLLISAGCNASVCDEKGDNVLVHAIRQSETFYGPLLELLVLAGADPLVKSDSYVLTLAVSKFCEHLKERKYFKDAEEHQNFFSAKLEALEFLFQLPHYFDKNVKVHWENCQTHPQYPMLAHLSQNSKVFQIINNGEFDFFLKEKYISVNALGTVSIQVPDCHDRNFAPKTEVIIDPLSFFINRNLDNNDLQDCYTALQKLLSFDFIVPHPSALSLLTLFLLKKPPQEPSVTFLCTDQKEFKKDTYDCDVMADITKLLITKVKVPVDQVMLLRSETSVLNCFPELILMEVPDAIYAAYVSGHVQSLRFLLQSFAGPPLSLLLCSNDNMITTFMYPVLAEWGPIQLDTVLFQRVNNHLQAMASRRLIPAVIYEDFVEKHGGGVPDEEMPQVIPGNFELPRNLGVVVCQDPDIAYQAQAALSTFLYQQQPLQFQPSPPILCDPFQSRTLRSTSCRLNFN